MSLDRLSRTAVTGGPVNETAKHPRDRLAWAAREYGAATVARGCGDLLSAGWSLDSGPDATRLTVLLGGSRYHLDRAEQGNPLPDYWPRVWAARGLLYVWDDCVEADVVAGLQDEHWRVREMCAKVVRLRELGSAAAALGPRVADPVPRVRVAALRALAVVAESEHLDALRDALHDPEASVVATAECALTMARTRLDLL